MPEIAEVEIVRTQLQPLEGRTLLRLDIEDVKLEPLRVHLMEIENQELLRVRRHGKLLGFELPGEVVLACHLRMTGALTFARQPHTRAVLSFKPAAKLYFSDPRKFGTLQATTDKLFASNLGPDVLQQAEMLPALWQRLQRSRRPLKAVLLDQSLLAGIGNYMADEICGRLQLHPQTLLLDLGEDNWHRVCESAQQIAIEAVARGGVSIRDYKHADGSSGAMQDELQFYGRVGQPCRRCQTPLIALKVAGRGTSICPQCQQLPKQEKGS